MTPVARIGLPRALHYYYWPGLWEGFFTALGMEVVVSEPTSEQRVQRATLISEPEYCLPAKLLDAHVESLIGRVDYLFVPRLLSHFKGHIACTKLAALPDALRCRLQGTPELITVEIDAKRRPFREVLMEVGLGLTRDRRKTANAARAAMALTPGAGAAALRREPAVVVLGHPYLMGDIYFTGPILRKLREMAVSVRLADLSETPAASFITWESSNRMYDCLCRLRPGECPGIVQLSCFNCGCDSMTLDFFREVAGRKGVPYMVLMLDEHTSCGGVETRLEAFVDSIRWRR